MAGWKRLQLEKLRLNFSSCFDASSKIHIRDVTNQNATQFENTETEKGPGRERRYERGKNKVTDANAMTEAER